MGQNFGEFPLEKIRIVRVHRVNTTG